MADVIANPCSMDKREHESKDIVETGDTRKPFASTREGIEKGEA